MSSHKKWKTACAIHQALILTCHTIRKIYFTEGEIVMTHPACAPPSPYECWNRLQHPLQLLAGISGLEDGWMKYSWGKWRPGNV